MAVDPEGWPVAVHQVLQVAGKGRGQQVIGIAWMDRL